MSRTTWGSTTPSAGDGRSTVASATARWARENSGTCSSPSWPKVPTTIGSRSTGYGRCGTTSSTWPVVRSSTSSISATTRMDLPDAVRAAPSPCTRSPARRRTGSPLPLEELGQPVGIGGGQVQGAAAQDLQLFLALVLVEPLDEQDAVEVVELVLEHPALELRRLDGDLVAVEVEADQVHGVGSHDLPAEPGDGQAAFVVDPLAVALDDARVDDGVRALTGVVDEDAALHAHLVGRQARSGSGVHGLDHGLDQAGHRPVDLLDVPRALLEDRVPVLADGHARHELHITGPLRSSFGVARRRVRRRGRELRPSWDRPPPANPGRAGGAPRRAGRTEARV